MLSPQIEMQVEKRKSTLREGVRNHLGAPFSVGSRLTRMRPATGPDTGGPSFVKWLNGPLDANASF
jgi:hypothetical protein